MAIKFTLQGEHLPYDELHSAETNSLIKNKVTHEFIAESLDEVLPAIKAFLLGLEYNPRGDLEFVDNFSSEEPFEYKDSWTEHNTKGNSE